MIKLLLFFLLTFKKFLMKFFAFLKKTAAKPVVQLVLAALILCYVIPRLNLDPEDSGLIMDMLKLLITVLLKI